MKRREGEKGEVWSVGGGGEGRGKGMDKREVVVRS